MTPLQQTFASRYCQIVFTIAFLGTLLWLPKHLLQGWLLPLAVAYAVGFGISMSCIVKLTKDRVSVHSKPHSLIGLVGSILGYAALQACGVSAGVCSVSVGLGVLTAILPRVILSFILSHPYELLIVALLMQFWSLKYLHCFQELTRPVISPSPRTIKLG